jgi:CubicO group peptidase (beta-lactamase class C family)
MLGLSLTTVTVLATLSCTNAGTDSATTVPVSPAASESGTSAAQPPASSSTASTAAGADWAAVEDLPPAAYTAVPISEDQIRAAIDQLDGIAGRVMDQTGVPGMAIAVVHGDKIVYAKGFGIRELGKPDLVDATTVFQLASVSKSIGASVVAAAVGDGIVSWDDPILKYLPDFELSDPAVTRMVTIGDLYSHRSGLPAAAGDDLEGLGFTREQVIEKLRLFPLNPFRISYGYTNFGMTTGGTAVAAAAGKSWEDLSRELLYQPLGMTHTSSSYAEFLTETNRATLHFKDGDTFEARYIRDADAQSPAGGVSSSVTDLGQWLRMSLAAGLVDGVQVVAADQLLAVHSPHATIGPPQLPSSRSQSYGYGVNIEATSTGHVKWSHSGAFFVGAGTAYAMLPAADVGIVVLTNGTPVGAAETITSSFSDLVRTGTIERDWLAFFGPIFASILTNPSEIAAGPAANPVAGRQLADYVGTYHNEYVGDIVVSETGGTLSVQLGPKAYNAPLTHYDGDVFSWEPPGGNGDPISAVTFAGSGTDGASTQVTLEFLNGANDFGVFTRKS